MDITVILATRKEETSNNLMISFAETTNNCHAHQIDSNEWKKVNEKLVEATETMCITRHFPFSVDHLVAQLLCGERKKNVYVSHIVIVCAVQQH